MRDEDKLVPFSSSRTRAIVKARRVAGSVVISLPTEVRKPLGIEAGDKVLVEVSSSHYVDDPGYEPKYLTITKE